MILEALKYLVSLGAANRAEVVPEAVEEVYFDKPMHRARPPREKPLAAQRSVSTLRSLAQYLAANVDGLDLSTHLLHVAEPGRVDLISSLGAGRTPSRRSMTPAHRRHWTAGSTWRLPSSRS